jgi:lysozyme family protein
MKFDEAYKLVGLAEGKWTDDPNDNGGMTACGIARNSNPNSKIWEIIDKYLERGKTLAETEKICCSDPYFMSLIQGIYKGKYWDSCKCDELPNLWRYPVFSCSVNCGSRVAVQILQKCINVESDGIYGGKTTRAVREYPKKEREFVDEFCEIWSKYYDRIVEKNPSQKKYINGWKNRIANVKKDNH